MQNNLWKVLQGEQVVTPPSHEAKSIGSESSHSGNHKFEETSKILEVLTQKLDASLSGLLGLHVKARLKAFQKQGQTVSPSSPTILVDTSNTAKQQQSMEIGTPITSLTPLQFSLGNPNSKIVFVDDCTPISP
jgi:hypothetical protein